MDKIPLKMGIIFTPLKFYRDFVHLNPEAWWDELNLFPLNELKFSSITYPQKGELSSVQVPK